MLRFNFRWENTGSTEDGLVGTVFGSRENTWKAEAVALAKDGSNVDHRLQSG